MIVSIMIERINAKLRLRLLLPPEAC
jgi:hypothetical protein